MREQDAITILVTDAHAGGRLDALLVRHLGLSRAQAKRLLDDGAVRLNGRRAPGKGATLAAGDRVEVDPFAHPATATPIPQPDLPLAIVASGDDWLIVDKPAGVAVHPLRPDETGTVLNALVARYPQVIGVGEGGLRSGVVHRLDVETSGVLLFARTQPAWERLRAAFTSRGIAKRYLAIAHGRLVGGREESMHLTVAQHRPARVRVVAPSAAGRAARRCSLRWNVREAAPQATLVEVDLGTGFLHQIRAMLAHLGHPLVGDTLYGGQPTAGAHRPMLHAHRVSLGAIHGEVEPPADFRAVWRELRGDQPSS